MFMVMLILMIVGLVFIVVNFATYLVVENTNFGRRNSDAYAGFRLLVTNVVVFFMLTIAATTMLATAQCVAMPYVTKSSCELVQVDGIGKQIYYSEDEHKFYTPHLFIDTIAPVERLRELSYHEQIELAEHIGKDYEHWNDLHSAIVIMSAPYYELDMST